jgi:ferredoxin
MWNRLILPVFASLFMAAHFSRVQNDWTALLCLLFPLILLIRRRWVLQIFQLYLIWGAAVWIDRLLVLRQVRIDMEEPWIRLAALLGVVALATIAAALRLEHVRFKDAYPVSPEQKGFISPHLIAFLSTFGLLAVIQSQVDLEILLAERFFPGSGWIEITLLSLYAAWITEKMLAVKSSALVRRRIWLFFSAVFFVQFGLGLAGVEKFLMTGALHLPIPAMILAGPIFRGARFFMPILFGGTLLLAGSAWCSHFCYVGAWDNLASRTKKRPAVYWKKWRRLRWFVPVLMAAAALALRLSGVTSGTVTLIAVAYGLGGVGMMILLSGKKGSMSHCTLYCPLGVLADILGKISPFRIRFTGDCDGCGVCRFSCRYLALEPENIERRRPGLSCTLCGDCLAACPKEALRYGFLGLGASAARTVFVVLVVVLHAVFLGVARI